MEFLLLLIFITLLYIAWKIPKHPDRQNKEVAMAAKKESMFASQLPALRGRLCEVSTKSAVAGFGYGMMGKGTVLDSDAEWLLLSSEGKGEASCLIRISQISEIREIK